MFGEKNYISRRVSFVSENHADKAGIRPRNGLLFFSKFRTDDNGTFRIKGKLEEVCFNLNRFSLHCCFSFSRQRSRLRLARKGCLILGCFRRCNLLGFSPEERRAAVVDFPTVVQHKGGKTEKNP